MKMRAKIIVLIATANNRNAILFGRALQSVFRQTLRPNAIVIVDDNDDNEVSLEIRSRIDKLAIGRHVVHYVPNGRTRHMSGTGAWNTGIAFISNMFGSDSYIAILDDDDEWTSAHLANCSRFIGISKRRMPEAVFAFLRRDDCGSASRFKRSDLKVESFLAGNPGVQGSNMFFRTGALEQINGFDERLASCTDRDLMIRFLSEFGIRNVRLTHRVTVCHHPGRATVSTDFNAKRDGLNCFYRMHLSKFDIETLETSLERARRLFSFPDSGMIRILYSDLLAIRERQLIVIGVMVHEDAATIRRCLESICRQKGTMRRIHVVIQDDDSLDNWRQQVGQLLDRSFMTIRKVKIGNVAKARSELNRFISEEVPRAELIGRLDADDEFTDEYALAKIERAFDLAGGADMVLGGNYLRSSRTGQMLKRTNKADRRLGDRAYLLERLRGMASGIKSAELPSCNMFLSPRTIVRYPELRSAEDHALLVHYLLRKGQYKIVFAEHCLPVIYSLGGCVTTMNKTKDVYLESRRILYNEALRYDG